MELYKLQEAAKLMGISFATLKQWIYHGKIRSVKTVGGHHRIPESEIARLTSDNRVMPVKRKEPLGLAAISGRNKLSGVITAVKLEGLLAQVTIDLGGQSITAIITRDACEELGLEKGVHAFALVKATEVMIIRG